MVIIRPTATLAKRARVQPETKLTSKSSTRLGDWYALDFVIQRRQYILCLSENARLSVVLSAAPYSTFFVRLLHSLKKILKALGVEQGEIDLELDEMKKVAFAKTLNRSIIGSLNEARRMLEGEADIGRFQQEDLIAEALYLADVPSSVLSRVFPNKELKDFFSFSTRKPA